MPDFANLWSINNKTTYIAIFSLKTSNHFQPFKTINVGLHQVKKVCNTRICYDLSNRFNKQIKCLHCSKFTAGRVFLYPLINLFFISLPNCMLVNRKWMTVGLKSMRRLTQQGRV